MRVLFDAYWWLEGPLSNRTVQREFIQAWAGEFPDDELTLLLPAAHLSQVDDAPSGATLVGTRLRPHGLAIILDVARLARRRRPDAILTHNFAPAFGRAGVFVHDVLFQSNPEWFTRPERAYFALMPLTIPRAEVVFSSSATEAARIRRYNRRVRRVEPVGLAVRRELATSQPRRPAALPAGVEDFVLTVGRRNVRKNLDTTLRAARASGVLGPDRPLVVVGEPDGRADTLAPDLVAAVERSEVVFLPRVDDSELAWLYGQARLFVFLSLDEGFGLTPIEARSFGAPCVVSDIAVFRENLDGQARFVDPLDEPAAAAAIAAEIAAPSDRPAYRAPSWTDSVRLIRKALLR